MVVGHGKDTEMNYPGRNKPVDVPQGFLGGTTHSGVEDIDLFVRLRHGIDRPWVLCRQINSDGQIPEGSWQTVSDLPFIIPGLGKAGALLNAFEGYLR